MPFLPLVPLGPLLPGGPATQTLPGARQTVPTMIDVTYFLITSRISFIPTESLALNVSTLRRAIVPLCSFPGENKQEMLSITNILLILIMVLGSKG